ncbi:hypothetical protein TorRG33x02_201680, partial [Trema orientale]
AATSSCGEVEVTTFHDDFRHSLAKSSSVAGKAEVPSLLALVSDQLLASIKLW